MKSSILLIVSITLAGLLVVPALVYAQYEQTGANAPISQPLVREGTLAVKLADALKLGTFSSEAEAESALGAAGIAPRNGWIADYPVTPDVAGELQNAVIDAADSKRVPMDRDGAVKAFRDVMVAYDLSVRPSAADQAAGNVPSYSPDQTIINNYYYDEGPPVVTYYAPPVDYAYLYSWVPYPFWWWDFWFPGFFVLADFDIHVHGDRHFHDGDRHFRDRDGDHFSNHFRDSRTGAMSRIDPANRSRGGTFSTRTSSGWTSVSAQNGARSIFNSRRTGSPSSGWRQRTALSSMNGSTVRSGSNVSPARRTSVSNGWNTQNTTSRTSFSNTRPYLSDRTFNQSSGGNRTFNTYRGSSFRSSGSTQTFQPRSSGSFSGWRSSGGVGSSSSRSSGSWHSSGGGMRSSGGWRR